MRDEFSEEVKKAVAQRVNYICSRPVCRAQTTGPQDDPSKAVNVGVAAHITAASEGGPRYDPEMTTEERKSPANAVWLCQTCAKLVDNDVVRFPAELLRKWKFDAEREARERVGKTVAGNGKPQIEFTLGTKLRITPVIPRRIEQDIWMVMEDQGDAVRLEKTNSATVAIPKSTIEDFHSLGNLQPSLLSLKGRLQWITEKQVSQFFPEKPGRPPDGDLGIVRDVDFHHPARENIPHCHWFRREVIHKFFPQGWNVYYGVDGRYLRFVQNHETFILLTRLP